MNDRPPSSPSSSAAQLASETTSSPLRIIGLTGGVGMGKTTISNYFSTVHHLPVLDADIYAREAVKLGSIGLQKLQERYGDTILLPTGELNRSQLGHIIFDSASERRWVEQQIHPYVRDQITTKIQTLIQAGYLTVVLVIPLLFEARMTDLVTEIWVVQTSAPNQIERIQQRDRLELSQIQARIASQMNIENKVAQADIVICNDSSLEALFAQVDRALHQSKTTS